MVILKIKTLHSTHKKTEKAIIIGVQLQGQALHIDEYLDELEQLARTSGGRAQKKIHSKSRSSQSQNVCGNRQNC